MALAQQTRPETLIVAWRRDAAGEIVTAACLTEMVELVDDQANTISAVREIPALAMDVADVVTVVGAQLPALIAERDAIKAMAEAAAEAAGQHLLDVVAAAAADKASAVEAVQAELAAAMEAAAADRAAALQAAEAAAAEALAEALAQRDALQARLDQLATPPDVAHVLNYRFKLALNQMGYLQAAEDLVAASGVEVRLRWQAPEIYRDDAMLIQMAALLAPTPEQASALIDQAFALAMTFA